MSSRTRTPRLSMALPVLLLGVGACAWIGERSQPPDRESEGARFHLALSAAEGGDFQEASRRLRALASRCESGSWGRESVLMLAALELSPRNPDGSPERASALLGRYLQSPTAPHQSVILAETLYLLALELGAGPVDDPLAPSPATRDLAPAWEGCGAPAEPVVIRPLPEHPGPGTLAEALRAGVARQEALETRADSLAALVETLRTRTAALEAELERIRRLLLPDTAQSPSRDRSPDP